MSTPERYTIKTLLSHGNSAENHSELEVLTEDRSIPLSGIEPKFFAKRSQIDPKDFLKITQKAENLADEHKYRQWSREALINLCSDPQENPNAIPPAKRNDLENNVLVAITQYHREAIGSSKNLNPFGIYDIHQRLLNAGDTFFDDVLRHLKENEKTLFESFFSSVIMNHPASKYQNKQMVKLTYPDKGKGKTQPEYQDMLRFVKRNYKPNPKKSTIFHALMEGFFALAARLWQKIKTKTPAEINESALKEWVANRVCEAFEFRTQKLDLVSVAKEGQEHNPDQFRLRAKFVQEEVEKTDTKKDRAGFRELSESHARKEAQKKQTIAQSFIKEGRIVSEDPFNKHVFHSTSDTLTDLAPAEAIMSTLSDYDTFGRTGANKGIIEGRLQVIDPGNAFKWSKTTLPNDRFESKGFKNFSVFKDIPDSQRMSGVILLSVMKTGEIPSWLQKLEVPEASIDFWQHILNKALVLQKNPNSDLQAFDEAIAFLSQKIYKDNPEKQALKKAILLDKNRYLDRRDQILNTFSARLNLSPREIDLEQHLEQLCSRTTLVQKTKTGDIIHLRHPHITDRVRCDISRTQSGFMLRLAMDNPAQSKKAQEKFLKFLKAHGIETDALKHSQSFGLGKEDFYTISLTEKQFDAISKACAEENIIHYKENEKLAIVGGSNIENRSFSERESYYGENDDSLFLLPSVSDLQAHFSSTEVAAITTLSSKISKFNSSDLEPNQKETQALMENISDLQDQISRKESFSSNQEIDTQALSLPSKSKALLAHQFDPVISELHHKTSRHAQAKPRKP